MKGFSEVVLGCWGVGRGVEGVEGNKRGRISGEEERFGGGGESLGKGEGR